ncbi:MAG: FAD:protein FMN transferase [Candidatus Nucleicultricaceae bacterium]
MQLYKFDFIVMGCPCSIQLYAPSSLKAHFVYNTLLEELRRLDRFYTNYADTSFTAEINQSAGNKTGIVVDPETAGLLDYAEECYRQSEGLFDITAGSLRDLWDFSTPHPIIPTKEALQERLKIVGWDKVEWKKPLLRLPLPHMAIDFGGVVKEYAADAAVSLARQHGIHHGIVELGGDIAIIGPHLDGRPWMIAITHPHKTEASLASIALYEGGLASSGDYERYIEIEGKRYCHILNPKTGWPVEGVQSVSVVASHCLIAGSASTIGFLKGAKKGPRWLHALGTPFLFVDAAFNMIKSTPKSDPKATIQATS